MQMQTFRNDYKISQMNTAVDGLNWMSGAGSFDEFKQRALQCVHDIESSIISSAASRVTRDQVDTDMIDWR